ncbi:single-stranded DNA-binding protein [Agromyces arachidis]|uniref:single-stranded DNA-binding protein n=1 Tax=Agromyces arachidis TaxID=766966 RepID=UPI004055F419
MTDLVTVTGFVGNDPRHSVTDSGLAITNFRLATTRRFFDRAKGEWADGETNWYSVAAFRQLAVNAAASVSRGDRVVVHGRLRVRSWETGEKSGTAVEIDADAIGHDLSWARTQATRTASSARTAEQSDAPPAEPAGDSVGGTDGAGDPADDWARPGATPGWPGGAEGPADASSSGRAVTADPSTEAVPAPPAGSSAAA